MLELTPIPINTAADVAREATVTVEEPADIVTESVAGFSPLKTVLKVISTSPKVCIGTTPKLPLQLTH